MIDNKYKPFKEVQTLGCPGDCLGISNPKIDVIRDNGLLNDGIVIWCQYRRELCKNRHLVYCFFVN